MNYTPNAKDVKKNIELAAYPSGVLDVFIKE